MSIQCKQTNDAGLPLIVEGKKSEYYFDKSPNKLHKKSSYYLKNASKGVSEYLLSDLRMHNPYILHGGASFTNIHAVVNDKYHIESDDNINVIGKLMTVDKLTKQIHNLSNGFYCPIIRNGELFFVSEDDNIKTAIDIDTKSPVKEYEI
uniref:Doublecortin domain-containing protein n=1 Tax=Strongyloides papillosus TaxID=174720 RepID=A0A0N5BN86_STREA